MTGDTPCSGNAAAPRPSLLVPLLVLAAAFGLAVAAVAVFRSGVLGSGGPDISNTNGNWLLSALVIASIAAAWLAGVVCLIRLIAPRGIGPHSAKAVRWTNTFAAFALGPVPVVLFFAALSLTRHPINRPVAYPVLAVVVLALVLARRLLRLLAGRLLLSFFLWLAILVAPAFWRDAVSAQISDFTFGLMGSAGLLR